MKYGGGQTMSKKEAVLGNMVVMSLGNTSSYADGILVPDSHKIPIRIGEVVSVDPEFRERPVGIEPGDIVVSNIRADNYGDVHMDEWVDITVNKIRTLDNGLDLYSHSIVRCQGVFKDRAKGLEMAEQFKQNMNTKINYAKDVKAVGSRMFLEVMEVDGNSMNTSGELHTKSGLLAAINRRNTDHLMGRIINMGEGASSLYLDPTELQVGDYVIMNSKPAYSPLQADGERSVWSVNASDVVARVGRGDEMYEHPQPIGDWMFLLHVSEDFVYRDGSVDSRYGNGCWVPRKAITNPKMADDKVIIAPGMINKLNNVADYGILLSFGGGITTRHPRSRSLGSAITGEWGLLPGDIVHHGGIFNHTGEYVNAKIAPNWMKVPNTYTLNFHHVVAVSNMDNETHRAAFGFCRDDYKPYGVSF